MTQPKRARRDPDMTVRLLEELIEHSKKVSPSQRMTVYVGDLEALLYYGGMPVPTKVGQKDDS